MKCAAKCHHSQGFFQYKAGFGLYKHPRRDPYQATGVKFDSEAEFSRSIDASAGADPIMQKVISMNVSRAQLLAHLE